MQTRPTTPVASRADQDHAAAASALRHGSNARKLARYLERSRWMIGTGFWVYRSEQDRFEEIVSIQQADVSPTKADRFIPNLMVYGREVYEAGDAVWAAFCRAHPGGIDALDCNPARDADRLRRGILPKLPSEGIRQPEAFAVLRDEKVRRTG